MQNIKIVEDTTFLNAELPKECLPKRFAIATNLILCTQNAVGEQAFLLFNYEPEKWNQWYPFFGSYNEMFDFEGTTYAQIVNQFKQEILLNKESKKRIQKATESFAKLLNIDTKCRIIETPIKSEMWLKFSKTQNIWTFYYMEFFQITELSNSFCHSIDDKIVTLLPLSDESIAEVIESGRYQQIDIVDNTLEILKNKHLLSKLLENSINIPY